MFVCACVCAYVCVMLGVLYTIHVQVEREGSVLLAYILVCMVGMVGVSLGK